MKLASELVILVQAIGTMEWLLIFLALASHASGENTTPNITPSRKLAKDLMEHYDGSTKPDPVWGTQLVVQLTFSLSRLDSLDEKNMEMSLFGGLYLVWPDSMLTWNSTDYGVDSLVVSGNKLWTPEIILVNSVDGNNDLTLGADSRVELFHHGYVASTSAIHWKTACDVDLYFFPFDTQVCAIQLSSWSYNANEMNITTIQNKVDTRFTYPNGEWDLVDSSIYRSEAFCDGVPIGTINMKLQLKRKPTYLVVNLVVPALVMSVMSLLVFCLPVDSGEKMSLGITVLLSYTVLLLMMSDITPRSNAIPMLTSFIIFSMTLSATALFATALVISIHHHSPDQPVPGWLRSSVLNGLAALLCMKRNWNKIEVGKEFWAQPVGENAKIKSNEQIGKDGIPQGFEVYLRSLKDEHQENVMEEKNKRDWRCVAKVMNRFFLCVYLGAFLVSAVVMLVGLSTGASNNKVI